MKNRIATGIVMSFMFNGMVVLAEEPSVNKDIPTKNPSRSSCLYLHTNLPVDVYSQEGEVYRLFRGNATSQVACESFKQDVEQEFPSGTQGIYVEVKPYGVAHKVEVNDKTGEYISTFSEKSPAEFCSVWIVSKIICPQDPNGPRLMGVSFIP